ncbi:glutamine synthetase family protein [Oceanobacillus sp. CAU 1775]
METKQDFRGDKENFFSGWDGFLEVFNKGEIDSVILAGIDMQGRLYGKKVPAQFFVDDLKNGVNTCALNFAWDISLTIGEFEYCNANTGFHDIQAKPILSTLRYYPWVEKTALVICDAYNEDKSLVDVAPRTILKKQVEKAKELGYSVQAASELEFHVYKETPESIREKNFENLTPLFPYPIDYSIYRLNVDDWFLKQLTHNLELANVPVDSIKGEWGLGQLELNVRHSEVLEMADRTAVYRNGIKEMSVLNQLMSTFMAKPATDASGSGGHAHVSLWNLEGTKNLFESPDGNKQLSKTGRNFLGGLLKLAPEFMLIYAPYINSYKRLADNEAGAPNTVTWGIDNRVTSFRTVGRGKATRIENRVPGADCNYYLVFAAIIASGLYGIENEIEPPNPVSGDITKLDVPKLPSNLFEAIEKFEKSEVVKEILGDKVFEHYLAAAKLELNQYFTEVTDFERKKYFEFI